MYEEIMKKKVSVLDIYVIFSIFALIVYTIVSQVLAYKANVELNVLTTCFFGFFGGEIVTCALIKIFKLHSGSNSNETENNSDIMSEEEINAICNNLMGGENNE